MNGVVVAVRHYDKDDGLWREQPVDQQRRPHGLVLEWHDNGRLELAEPYFEGLIHGTARQWDYDGTFLGTYTLQHGTGYDIWRDRSDDGAVFISEIHPWRSGRLHGFQWWFNEDQSLHWERPFFEGKLHGIERSWNNRGRLRRDCPAYWIRNEKVDKRRYLRAARTDSTLPPFRPEDHSPARIFPPEIQSLFDAL